MRKVMEKKLIIYIVIFLAAWCSTFSLIPDGFSLEAFILFILFVTLYRKLDYKREARSKFVTGLLATSFSIFTLLGKFYSEWCSSSYIENVLGWRIIIYAVGYWTIFYYLIDLLYRMIDKVIFVDYTENKRKGVAVFAFCFTAILLFWLPYIIIMWPGSIEWDALVQLAQYFGDEGRNNHHPYISSAIMGVCVETGKKLFKSDNVGLFIYTFSQCVITITIMSYSFILLNKMYVKKWICCALLLFYGLFTIYPSNAYYMDKGSMYSAFCIVLVYLYILCMKFNQLNWKWMILAGGLATFFIIAFRKDGIYLLLGSYLAWGAIFACTKKRKAMLMVVFLLMESLVLNMGYHNLLMPKYNIAEGRVAEALSIPLQQTARYCLEHPDEITEEEKDILSKYFLASDELADSYNPEISDAVKGRFRAETTEEIEEYFGMWWGMLKKHPMTYIKATLNNIYGYFYPVYGECVEFGSGSAGGTYRVVAYAPRDISVWFEQWNTEGTYKLEEFAEFLKHTPCFGFMYSMGTYIWFVLFGLGLCIIKRRYYAMGVMVPIIIDFLICCASPVNGYIRYMLPIIYMLPISMIYILQECKEQNSNGFYDGGCEKY